MKRFHTFLFLFFILNHFSLLAQPSALDLLSSSKEFYTKTNAYAFTWIEKFKPAINQDTLTNTFNCFYQKAGDQKAFKMVFSTNNYAIYDNNYGYFAYSDKKTYYSGRSNGSRSSERLVDIPVWDWNFFFKELPNKVADKRIVSNVEASSDGNGYTITMMDQYQMYRVTIDTQFRVSNYKNVISIDLGVQVKDYSFIPIDTNYSSSILDELAIVKSTYRNVTNDKRPSAQEVLKGRKLSMDSLAQWLGYEKPYPQYVCIDFFYKSCYPCTKAIPELEEISHTVENSVLKVVGVDPVPQDTGKWESFRQRYSMTYPVLDGINAQTILNYFFKDVSISYPTQVILSSEGQVLDVVEGYTKNRIKKALYKIGLPNL